MFLFYDYKYPCSLGLFILRTVTSLFHHILAVVFFQYSQSLFKKLYEIYVRLFVHLPPTSLHTDPPPP